MDNEQEKIIRLEYERRKRAEEQENNQKKPSEPLFNIPPMTLRLVLILCVAFGLQKFTTLEIEYWIIQNLAFIPQVWSSLDLLSLWVIISPISYSFLHADFLHLGINGLMLLAFGAGIERFFGKEGFIKLYLYGAVIGAFSQFIFDISSTQPIVGASASLSAFFGALLIVMHRQGRLGNVKSLKPFILLWVVISIGMGFLGVPGTGFDIAWAAHLGGFFTGLAFVYYKK